MRDDVCPYCGHIITAATNADLDFVAPKAGDLTICIECYGECYFFPLRGTNDLILKPLLKAQREELSAEVISGLHMARIRLIDAKRRSN